MTRPAEPIYRHAEDLKIGDVIAARWLPQRMPAEVLFPYPYRFGEHDRVHITFRYASGEVDSTNLLAKGAVPINP